MDGLISENGPVIFKKINTDGLAAGTVIYLSHDTELTYDQLRRFEFRTRGYQIYTAPSVHPVSIHKYNIRL